MNRDEWELALWRATNRRHRLSIGRRLVAAWLERRPLETGDGPDSFATDGWRISGSGDVMVCRAPWSELALVCGKRYRSLWQREFREALEIALAYHRVPTERVAPPAVSAYYVTADDLVNWWRLSKRDLSDEYRSAAETLVDAWQRGTSASFRISLSGCDTYAGAFNAHCECIAATVRQPRIVVLSAKRFRAGSHQERLRDALRTVLSARGIPFVERRPYRETKGGYTIPADLLEAWRREGIRLA